MVNCGEIEMVTLFIIKLTLVRTLFPADCYDRIQQTLLSLLLIILRLEHLPVAVTAVCCCCGSCHSLLLLLSALLLTAVSADTCCVLTADSRL